MQELSDEYIVENSVSDDDFTRKLKSLGVSVSDNVRYHIEYTFGNRNIAAINADGQMLKSVINGSVYDFRQGSTAMPDDLQTYVMNAMDSYTPFIRRNHLEKLRNILRRTPMLTE